MHDNAVRIAHDLMRECRDVSIVYSDPDPGLTLDVRCRLIRRPNESPLIYSNASTGRARD